MRDLLELCEIQIKLITGEAVIQHVTENNVMPVKSSYSGFRKRSKSMFDTVLALRKILRWEGGYVNDPDDSGGETIFGISRRSWPNLNLWSLLDEYKSIGMRKDRMENNVFELSKGEILSVYNTYLEAANQIDCPDQDFYTGVAAFIVNAGKGHVDRLLALSDPEQIKTYILNHYRRVISKSPKKSKYKRGWTRRLQDTFNDERMVI